MRWVNNQGWQRVEYIEDFLLWGVWMVNLASYTGSEVRESRSVVVVDFDAVGKLPNWQAVPLTDPEIFTQYFALFLNHQGFEKSK